MMLFYRKNRPHRAILPVLAVVGQFNANRVDFLLDRLNAAVYNKNTVESLDIIHALQEENVLIEVIE